ncbi:MAG: pentapeptide repeat-containing protein, partial [Planctomycetota bacterium]|nr:pentapeptide repeat-containing protein [Planctomycetota bacterium]
MTDPSPITILHISDIQFGHQHRFGRLALGDPDSPFDTLLGRLTQDLDQLRDQNGLKPNLLVVSGDLAEWGRKSEFEDALKFLVTLAEHLQLPRRRVIVVPGNHDVSRKLCESYFNECEARETEPERPFWRKWEFFQAMLQEFYHDEPDLTFVPAEPWTWYQLDDLRVVVAGLNSTMPEIHGEEDVHKAIKAAAVPPRDAYQKWIHDGACGHFGRCGEKQLNWFADRLKPFVADGWLRIGVMHHNPVRGPENDDENLKDILDLKRLLAPSLNLVLHGHTHFGALNWLNQHLPAISTGSAGLGRAARPEETPNQYQLLQLFPDRFVRWMRCYDPPNKKWIGDTRCSDDGNNWQTKDRVTFQHAHAVFPEDEPWDKLADPKTKEAKTDPDVEPLRQDADRDDTRDAGGIRSHSRTDFFSHVADVCRLREPEEARVVEQLDDESGIPYLRVTCRSGLVTRHFPIGVMENDCSLDGLQRFLKSIDASFRAADANLQSYIVYGGPLADALVVSAARKAGVQLLSFEEYLELTDFRRYKAEQNDRLERDPIYPPRLYVPQRYWHHVGNQRQPGDNVTEQVFQWLEQPDARFVLVLGEFGTGKTFLLHELARQMPKRLPHLTPVLIEMRSLERGHPVDVLVSMHMIATREERFDIGRFRYMLRHGRICLLFDGFDELALRVTYDRAAEHLAALVDAAQGQAKVVVTSRTQHFLSEQQVKQALYAQIDTVSARRLVELRSFELDQVRSFLVNYYRSPAGQSPLPPDDAEVQQLANHRMTLIRDVQDLQGLSANPRLLSFIAELDDQRLLEARDPSGQITAADLYQIILDKWLEGEVRRRQAHGGLKTLEKDHLWAAVTRLALRMWETGQRSVDVGELTEQVQAARKDLPALDMTAHEAAFEIGAGSLLVRDREGRFSFVHRSVMEWLIARDAAAAVAAGQTPQSLEQNEVSPLMADFVLGLAKPDRALAWATDILGQPGGIEGWLKKNALLIQQRHQELRPAPATEAEPPPAPAIDLAGQDLRGKDFTGRDLRRANLRGADLTEARLDRADLREATLDAAILARTSLLGADLRGASVVGAVFRRAKLIGAKLGAEFAQAVGEERLLGAALPMTLAHPPNFSSPASPGNTLAVSPDGTLIASGHNDGSVRLWDVASAKELRACNGHQGSVGSVAFSPDGRQLASGSSDKSVRLWDVASAKELRVCNGHQGYVGSVAFSPDGRQLASGSDDNSVRLWDVASAKELRVCNGHQGSVRSVAFSPDGRQLASGSHDKSVRLWDVAS